MIAYSEVIGSLANDAGLPSLPWEWCTPYRSSVDDCPISSFDMNNGKGMFVAVHNPSDTGLEEVAILVPHGNYSAQVWDDQAKMQKDVPSDVVCEL